MKKFFYIILFIIYSCFSGFSQGTTCGSATAFCSGVTTFPASTGAGTAESGPNYGCLSTQPNPAWFYLQIGSSGNISLTINSSPLRDIDFIVYGPFTTPTAPCSSGLLTAANTQDCSYMGGTAAEVADITGAIAGQYYLLLLTNYSNQPTNVSFNQSGGTGSTSCGVLCSITSLTVTPSACAPATNTYSLTGQIAFNTQPTTGTLTVTSSCGGSQTFNAPFVSPLNYNIPGIVSNGAACSVTAVFSAMPSCTKTTNYTAPANCTPCTATANNNGPICSGAFLILSAGTVTGATSYSWAGPNGFTSNVQNPSIAGVTVNATGTYTVTVTTASAVCTATTTATVNQRPSLPTAGSNSPVCSGSTLNLTTPAVAGATYNWSGPGGFVSNSQNPSIPSVTNAATGTYSVTVTSNGCTSAVGTTSVIINNTPNPPIPSINASTTPAGVCAGATLTLTANNIAGAVYSWTGPNGYTAGVRNPPPILNSTPAMSGTYSLTVTVGGCTSNPGTVTITVSPTPAAPTVSGTAICSGNSVTLTATAPGGTYNWYDAPTAGNLIGTGSAFTTPVLTATTTYYVQSTINGCTGPRTAVTVTVAQTFTVTTSANDSICSGASTTISVINPTGAFNYSWDRPGSIGFSTSVSPTVTPISTTTYTVTVTDATGCSGTKSVTITVGTPLTISAIGIDVNCFGSCDGTSNVVANGSFAPYNYIWSNGSTASSLSGLCIGTYSVTVTDLIGCSSQGTILIQGPTPLLLTTSSSTAHCNQPDGSASVSVTGGVPGYSYIWTAGVQNNDTAINLLPGPYTVQITDSRGCQANATVTVPNAPGVNASGTFTPITCYNGCDGTATITATGGSAPYTYLWSNGQTTAIATGLCTGTYTCTVTDATGCTNPVIIFLSQPPAVTVNTFSSIPAICIGQSATLNASASGGTGSGYVFNWQAPAFTGNPYIVTPGATTSYLVSAIDGSGCASINTQTVVVTVNSPLSVVASNDKDICKGINAVISATATGGNGVYTYTWGPGGTTSGNSTFNVTPNSTTNYTVTVTDGCSTPSVSDMVKITVQPLPAVDFNSTKLTGCEPLCLTLNNTTTITDGSIISWSWNINGTNYTTPTVTDCFSAGTYTVSLNATSNFNCVSSKTIPDIFSVSAMPVAGFIYSPNPISISYPEVQFTDVSTNATASFWNFGDSLLNPLDNNSNSLNPNHTYSDAGEYCVTLITTNTLACADTVTHCLIVEADFSLYIPNAFTPNGNGLNDEFFVKGQNIAKFDMKIYNRWGDLVFQTDNIEEHWNGVMKGGSKIAPQGVYAYIINLKDKAGETHQYMGHITIVK